MPFAVPAINAAQIIAQDSRQGGTVAFARYILGHYDGTTFTQIIYEPGAPLPARSGAVLRAQAKEVTVPISPTDTRQTTGQALVTALLAATGLNPAQGDRVLAPDGTLLPLSAP